MLTPMCFNWTPVPGITNRLIHASRFIGRYGRFPGIMSTSSRRHDHSVGAGCYHRPCSGLDHC